MDAETLSLEDALVPARVLLSGTVLGWCRRHPYIGDQLEHLAADPQIRRLADGQLWLERAEAPDVVLVTMALLDEADPALLYFDQFEGVLTFAVLPAPLRYQVLYPHPALLAVTCRLLREKPGTARARG